MLSNFFCIAGAFLSCLLQGIAHILLKFKYPHRNCCRTPFGVYGTIVALIICLGAYPCDAPPKLLQNPHRNCCRTPFRIYGTIVALIICLGAYPCDAPTETAAEPPPKLLQNPFRNIRHNCGTHHMSGGISMYYRRRRHFNELLDSAFILVGLIYHFIKKCIR